MSSKKFRIADVQISGFRGYRDELPLNLNAPIVLLFGGNGSGKSSTVGAIEWCLFGDFTSITADRRGSRDELIHELCGRTNVTLHLSGPKKLTVKRFKKRQKKQTDLSLKTNGEPDYTQKDAERELYSNLNLGFDDFTRAVYLHQENVRGMLVDDPSSRNETMDRLFGLERLRNISDGLYLKKVKDAVKDLSARREKALSSIQSRLDESSREYEQAKIEAAKVGVPEDSLELPFAKGAFKRANEAATQLTEAIGADVPKIPPPTSVESLKNAAEVLRSLVRNIRGQLPGQKEISDLTMMLSSLKSIQSELAESVTRYGTAQRKLKDFEKEHGTEDELKRHLKKAADKMEELRLKREESSSKEKVIKDGLEYLLEFTPTICPICGERIDAEGVCHHLRVEVEKVVGEKLKQLDDKIAETSEKKEELEDLLDSLHDMAGKLENEEDRVDSVVEELAKELGQPISSAKKGMGLLENRCSDIVSKKEKLERPLRKREKELQQIETWVSQMEAIAQALRLDERRNELANLQKAKAFEKVDKTLRRLGELEQIVSMVAETVQYVQGDLARSLVNDAMPRINQFYGELVGHPYYKDLQIVVETKRSRGRVRNSYNIIGMNPRDGAETLASDRFSTGQMNCVALSIFLAMAHKDAFSHNLGFLILDDPSQNLDTHHKETLCRILAKVAKKRQLVISSQDAEFQGMLGSTFEGEKAIVYEFGQWSIDGPVIKQV